MFYFEHKISDFAAMLWIKKHKTRVKSLAKTRYVSGFHTSPSKHCTIVFVVVLKSKFVRQFFLFLSLLNYCFRFMFVFL